MANEKGRKHLRSYEWFGRPGRDSMVHRSWMGVDLEFLVGKSGAPVARESH